MMRARDRAARVRALSSGNFTATCRENFSLVAVHAEVG
jgi:hypothetical protein